MHGKSIWLTLKQIEKIDKNCFINFFENLPYPRENPRSAAETCPTFFQFEFELLYHNAKSNLLCLEGDAKEQYSSSSMISWRVKRRQPASTQQTN